LDAPLNPDPRSDPSSGRRTEAVEDFTGRRKDDPYQFRYRGRIGNIAAMTEVVGASSNIASTTVIVVGSERRHDDRERGYGIHDTFLVWK